jgi:HEAT repeat protein
MELLFCQNPELKKLPEPELDAARECPGEPRAAPIRRGAEGKACASPAGFLRVSGGLRTGVFMVSRTSPLLLALLLSCSGGTAKPRPPAPTPEELKSGFLADAKTIVQGDEPAGAYLVMEAVGDLGLQEALPLLTEGMRSEEPLVRARAVASYGRFPKADPAPLKPLLQDSSFEVRLRAAGALAALGDAEARAFLEGFLKDSKPLLDETAAAGEPPGGRLFREGYYRAVAGEALTLAGGDGRPALREALANPYHEARFPAALALAQLGDEAGLALLKEGLESGYVQPRMAVYLYSLSPKAESLAAAIRLYAQARADESTGAAAVAAWALAKANAPEVIPFLEDAARAEALDVRFMARWALLTPRLSQPPPKIDPAQLKATPAPASSPSDDPHAGHKMGADSQPGSAPDSQP